MTDTAKVQQAEAKWQEAQRELQEAAKTYAASVLGEGSTARASARMEHAARAFVAADEALRALLAVPTGITLSTSVTP